MIPIVRTVVFLVFGLLAYPLLASDACLDLAINTSASVTVSDGSHFGTESFFQSVEFSAIKHIREDKQVVAVEGPLSWVSRGEKAQLGDEGLKQFALGHQFHALLLHFDDLVTDIVPRTNMSFLGGQYQGRGGKYPYGGEIVLIQNGDDENPRGFVLALPDAPPMEIRFSDWRNQDDTPLPFHIEIDDGTSVFNYRYSHIEITRLSPSWYFNTVEAPEIDRLQLYRLHRKLLVAHCIGDADMLADLSTRESTISGRGSLNLVSRESMRTRFKQVFERIDYLHYEDIVSPIIEVSESGDMGWIAVNVRTRGMATGSDQSFDDQWSWIMLARKSDGKWLNAGNASNRMPGTQ